MVYELGHVCDQLKNNNFCVRDLQTEGGFASNSHKKRRRGNNNVNEFIGDIAKQYMETTEGENWASDLIDHLNSRFPTSIDASNELQNFTQQEVQYANLNEIVYHGVTSSNSPLPDLIPPVFRNPSSLCREDYSKLGYTHYKSASVNIYNSGLRKGLTSESVSCGGMNLVSPLGLKQTDLELITSPEQVSSVTACSYGDMVSDTEGFDSKAAQPVSVLHSTSGPSAGNFFQPQPSYQGQYRSSIGNKRTTYNMDSPLLMADDVQSPHSNSCLPKPDDIPPNEHNMQRSLESQFQMPVPQHWAHRPPVKAQEHVTSESLSHISSFQILSEYVTYKAMPAELRNEISFQNYMHATTCAATDGLCNCPLYLQLASHFDQCDDLNCNICGPVRSSCGATGNTHLESRKRKKDLSEAAGDEGFCSIGNPEDTLPTKCQKTENSEALAFNEDAQKVQEPTGLKEGDNITNGEIKNSPAVSCDHHSLGERTHDEKEKSGQHVIEENNGFNSAPDSVKPLVLESEKTEVQIASLDDSGPRLEPEKIKIQSVSLANFFTSDQIREHLMSFTAPKKQDVPAYTSQPVGQNTCHLCSMDKLVFAPAPLYCSSCDIRIKRNVGYYRSSYETVIRHCFCMSCYRGSHGTNILMRGFSIPKANLLKAKNDEEKEDSWVQCDRCQCWQHRICGLYNDERDVEGKAEYICPKCYLEEIESGVRVPLPQTATSGAKDLPRTNLSDHIEQRLARCLEHEREEMAKASGVKPEEVPGADGLVVRVVVSYEKHLDVKKQYLDILNGEDYPSEFVYRSKLIFLFQKIEGVDVCLFGMCVQEFGSECGGPNHRCVYISYLDSVKYFRPERKSATGESLRTFVYHEILIGYLEYCKKRGFATCYIWACPLIKGEDYIFYCHPESQKTPKQDKLRQWYKSMLKKASEDNVVVEHTNLYSKFFVPSGQGHTKITAARLPYFDGDYWSGAAENIVRKLVVEESAGGLQSKLPNRRTLKAMGQDNLKIAIKDVLVMQKLGQTILPVKENFMIVHLQYICTHCHEVILSGSKWFCNQCKKLQLCSRCFDADKNLSNSKMHTCHSGDKGQLSEVMVNNVALDTQEKEDVLVNSFFETRDAFLNKCQKSHFQFDTLTRAKYSSMMILYHLIHKPAIKPTKSEEFLNQKPMTLKAVLDVLVHASRCMNVPCVYSECRTIRRLFYHASRCGVRVRGGCSFCCRAWRILKEHSEVCRDPECPIPRCLDIKKYKETKLIQNQQEAARVVVG